MNLPGRILRPGGSRTVPAAAPALERRELVAILVSVALLAGIWLMPTPAGLPVAGQRTLAVTLLGAGPTGRYGSHETLRYGLPLTVLTMLVLLLEVAWWQVAGLIE